MTNADLAERLDLSQSPCLRRVKALEESGANEGYRAQLNAKKLGLGVQVCVKVKIGSHSEADARAFEKALSRHPEITSCHSISGMADFFLQVMCRDLDHYADFSMDVLRRFPGIKEMNSSFALKEIKSDTDVPVSLLPQR